MSNVSAILFHQYGPPAEVIHAETIPISDPKTGEARVRVLASPINPADLNLIEGKYGISPALPAVPGIEGVGVVEEIGENTAGVGVGERVLLPHGFGSWREAGIMKADELRRVPHEIPIEQAAMLKVNPATAMRLLRDFVDLKAGDWVLQNAANSSVGRHVIQIARHTGFRTANVVRRPELIPELEALGADSVIVEGPDMNARISAATGGAAISLALNAVGGESASELAKALAPCGTLVTYGAMGRKPLRISNALLIFQDLRCRGFWISQWYRNASAEAKNEMFAEIFDLAKRGILHAPVEKIYPFSEYAAALAHAASPSRPGKILFGVPE
jgi:mitochondrial enoyl-[acyl-carrier protein] reductase / trans-2-enoyl-CoA reductase